MRGQRRGGRSRPHHERVAPITEDLDKLSLSSDCAEKPAKAKAQGNRGQQVQGNPELCPSKTDGGVKAMEQEAQVPMCQSGLETEFPKDAADSAGSRGHRGRRRGHYRPAPHSGAAGPARHHWDDRGSRSRGGANNLCGRGGGPRRGHGRGFQQKVVETGREEVL